MKKLLLGLIAALIACGTALAGEVGSYPNASALGDLDRFLMDQSALTRNATSLQIGAYTAGKVAGDCTINTSTFSITCTKTSGLAFVSSATVDTTNATNITSGTLAPARLNAPGTITLLNAVTAVNAVATANIATMSGAVTIDGIAVPVGQNILLTAQTTTSQNGIWTVNSGAWTRPTPFPSGFVISANCDFQVLVQRGTVNQGQTYWLNTTANVTIDTTAQSWSRSTISIAAIGGVSGSGTVATADCASWDTSGTTYGIADTGDLNSNKGACLTQSQTTGHSQFTNGGAAPGASAGTINANSTDEFGVVTGLSAATTLTITFGAGFPNSFASCTANSSPALAIGVAYTVVSTNVTAVVFSFASLTGSLSYHCKGTG